MFYCYEYNIIYLFVFTNFYILCVLKNHLKNNIKNILSKNQID